jgi:hypothetical protein
MQAAAAAQCRAVVQQQAAQAVAVLVTETVLEQLEQLTQVQAAVAEKTTVQQVSAAQADLEL